MKLSDQIKAEQARILAQLQDAATAAGLPIEDTMTLRGRYQAAELYLQRVLQMEQELEELRQLAKQAGLLP
jgi:hypothetical protein